jgi:Zn finger protein HypA/HybF involved in hydrogenase expression
MHEVKTWCTHCKTYNSFDIPKGTSAEQALGQPCPNCGTRGRLTRVEE